MNDAITLALVGVAVIGCAFGVLVIAVLGVRASDFDEDEPCESYDPPATIREDERGRR